ncbi:class I SAM-dependent methyltransferase [Mycobacterium sp. 3519A]|uniref:class I SAM-dependent methyltransferase n=1 Tax=Mycobacterium sp. 3519A TaxID=2057184 RepID=UPI000C7B8B78|nr:class I SAM-dependent methyltransferase [Mycobacterium sp. 3519A]
MANQNYVLGHSHPEIDRLMRQAEMLRPITERLLVAAGIEPGMRVLDIGCGPGDVSLLIADLVGPTGSVVGIDRSEAALDIARERFRHLGQSNVEFIRCDLETYVGPADFDAAVCRYVLIHQADPAAFLRATRRLVRTGGVIALHEMDVTRGIQSSPRIPLLHEIYDAVTYTLTRQGTAFDVGGRFVEVFVNAGLPAPQMFSQTLVESGEDSVFLTWMVDLAREVLPHMIAAGAVTADQVQIDTLSERLRHAAIASSSQLEFVPQTCAWARNENGTRACSR